MKKLMIALAAVAMSAIAQAASIDWQFTETAMLTKNPMDLSSYTAYLFTADSWSTVLASDSGNGISLDAFNAGYIDTATIAQGSVGGGKGVTYDTSLQTSDGVTGSYYIVLADDNGYIASGALDATQYVEPTDQHIAAKWTVAATGAPITAVTGSFENVPEPTSGLLLLLGMAGLALRRRRA